MGTEQLLSVPKLENGTGQAIANAIFTSLTKWSLLDKIQAICFGTTSSNTGNKNGAAVILEKMIKRSLLWLPCRHHIYELILKEIFLYEVDSSSGPVTALNNYLNDLKNFGHQSTRQNLNLVCKTKL